MNRKKLIIIIVILLVLLIITGIVLYYNSNKNKEIFTESDTEGAYSVTADNPEELLEKIRLFYADNQNVIVTYDKEEDDCWYYHDSDNNSYFYCLNEQEIKKMS